jgi:hypothetical protein
VAVERAGFLLETSPSQPLESYRIGQDFHGLQQAFPLFHRDQDRARATSAGHPDLLTMLLGGAKEFEERVLGFGRSHSPHMAIIVAILFFGPFRRTPLELPRRPAPPGELGLFWAGTFRGVGISGIASSAAGTAALS